MLPVLLPAPPDFPRDVRPILTRSCVRCHGPAQQRGGVRFDNARGAAKAIAAHQPDASPLLRRVKAAGDERMPPAGNPGLTAAEVETLRAWIAAGAAWPGGKSDAPPSTHWSLKPLRRPVVPSLPPGIRRTPPLDSSTRTRGVPRVPALGERGVGKLLSHGSRLRHQTPPRLPRGPGGVNAFGGVHAFGYAGGPGGTLGAREGAGSLNPIDAFVGARLSAKKLGFSPAADRRTLLRRVAFDLTGLPPTPQELAAFVADTKPSAYERVVDRLLASPAYGERWARHWLDTVHFADSHGFEHDIARDNAWPYRDYVIDSLNADTPWPRFVKEQIAADVLWPDRPELIPALGFLGAGPFDLSAYNTAPMNFEMLDRDDLVNQTMTAFASTTAACARCHAHKFDPIPQTDYWALQAVFAGIVKGDRTYEKNPADAATRARWMALADAAKKRDPKVLLADENRPMVDAFVRARADRARWSPLRVDALASSGGATLKRAEDGAFVSAGVRPEVDTVTVTGTPAPGRITALRLEVLADDSLPMRGPGRQDNGNLHLTEIDVALVLPGAPPRPLRLTRATADFNQDGWGVARAIDGDPKSAWGIYPAVGQSHAAVFALAEPVTVPAGGQLIVALHQRHGGGHLIGHGRLSVADGTPAQTDALPPALDEALAAPETHRLDLAAFALARAADDALAKLPPAGKVFAAGRTVDVPTVGMRTIETPRAMHVLARGEIDKPLESVGPGALSAVAWLPARFPLTNADDEGARRAALADWLVHRDNPLTWRSIVNRVWQYHFGRGLCDTPGDFGQMGGVPSHPELIDWLAVWLRDDAGGSLKKLHRLIVTSQTYRQSSAPRADAAKVDGDNRLLWRQNRLRLDADAYRDFALAVSGKLDTTRGGPGVKQFSMGPGPQLTPALDYTKYDWNSPGAGRRSIYRTVWRGIADPFLEALDFPDLGLLAPTRGNSVSALQALALYNDPFVLNCSAALAASAGSVDAAVERAWLRRPTADERRAFDAFVQRHGLPALCRVLLNANDFLFVD